MMPIALVDRLRRQQDLGSYRRLLVAVLSADPILRDLPSLRQLRCVATRDDGVFVTVDSSSADRVLLRGAPGSGRSLAVAQIAQAWLDRGAIDMPAPLPIDLAALDDGQASPNALLTALVAQLSQGRVATPGRWSLLVSGLEYLPPARATLWRAALRSGMLPAAVSIGMILAVLDEPSWPGLTTLTIGPASPEDSLRWCVTLAGTARATELVRALGPLPSLQACAQAAWLLARGALPLTQFDRDRMLLDLFALRPAPSGNPPPGLGAGMGSWPAQSAALLHQAEQIAARAAYTQVLAHPQRARLALLVAGRTASDGIVRVLVRAARQDVQLWLLAGQCILERAPSAPALALYVIAALGRLAQQGQLADRAQMVLGALEAIQAAAISVALERRAFRAVAATLLALPAERGQRQLAELAYAPTTPAAVAWRCAKAFIQVGSLRAGQYDDSAIPSGAGLARWVFVQAMQAANGHARLLATPAALAALPHIPAVEREQAVLALLANTELPVLIRLSALDLLETDRQHDHQELLLQLSSDHAREVRIAALTRLVRAGRGGLATVTQIAQHPNRTVEQRADAITVLAHAQTPIAVRPLFGCLADATLPLDLRIAALRGLCGRRGARAQLLGIAQDRAHDPTLRAVAIHALDMRRPRRTTRVGPTGKQRRCVRLRVRIANALAWLLDDPSIPPLVALAACGVLAVRRSPIATVALIGVIERAPADIDLTLAAIVGLGQHRSERVITALAGLLGAGALERLQRVCPVRLLRAPLAQALAAPDLPSPLWQRLNLAALSGLRQADRPTTLREFLLIAADDIRTAAAQTLAQIGGKQVLEVLTAALVAEEHGSATPALIDALARVCGLEDAGPLAAVVKAPTTAARVRWLAAQRMADHPAALKPLLECLGHTELDAFTRGALAAGLGRCQVPATLTTLAALALDRGVDPYLREQALVGIGVLGTATSDALLLRFGSDPSEDVRLRGAALRQLSPAIDAQTRWSLRNMLRVERIAPELLIGGLCAIGRAIDREAMPLLLQHSLDDRSEVARAAIDALAQLHDPTVSSVLVGLSQKASADRNLRLHAVGALLRMNEPDAPLLLRDYLHSPILPIQIQALEQLIGAGAPAAQLLTLAADPRRAPAFRLRALDAVGRIDSAILVAPILAQRSDPPELRGRAAQLITQIGGPDAQQILAQVAANADDHPGVRVACINGLAQRRDPHAAHVLAQIATGIDEDAIRARAAVALVAVHTN